MKRGQIVELFTKYGKEDFELWFSGDEMDGKYKAWYENGQLWEQGFFKNGKLEGEFKRWHSNGKLYIHKLYKDGEEIKDYLA